MNHRVLVVLSGATAVVVGLVWSGIAPTARTSVPKTPWGHPDLHGVWDYRTVTPLERPASLANREFLTEDEAAKLERQTIERNARLAERPAERTTVTNSVDTRRDGSPGFYNNLWLDSGTKPVATRRTSLVINPPDGKLPPLTAGSQERARARQEYLKQHPADSWLDRSLSDRCLVGWNAGPPMITGPYNNNVQLFQTPDHIALHLELNHTVRIVPLDGRPHVSDRVRKWVGDSRGRWEGETLIVETVNFRDDPGQRIAYSKSMGLVERFTRIDAETLDYTFTVTDPETWTKPWTASIPMRRARHPVYEFACHEGNYSLANILSARRAIERGARRTR